MRLKLNKATILLGFFLLTIFNYVTYASTPQEEKKFILQGEISVAKGNTNETVITLIRNSSDKKEFPVSRKGDFVLKLDYFTEYEIIFQCPGHYKKKILVSTQMPKEVLENDSYFPEFPIGVNLFEVYTFLDGSFAEKPAGKIFFKESVNDFEAIAYQTDREIKRRIDIAKLEHKTIKRDSAELENLDLAEVRERKSDFQNLLKEANKLYERGEYELALIKYKEASELFPDEGYPKDRIAEIEDLVAAMNLANERKQKIEKEFAVLMAKADEQFNNKQFEDALATYKQALDFRPNDSALKNKIAETERQLLLQKEQLAYDEAIKAADDAFNAGDYAKAKEFYLKALALRPKEKYPRDRIAEIDRLLQQKVKDDAYSETLAEADKLFNAKKYDEALKLYQQASQIKNNEEYPRNRIDEIDQLLKQAKIEKEYNELIADANKAFDRGNLEDAKALYSEALKLKPDDEFAKKRIAEIDAALDERKRKEQVDADYKQNIAMANAAFKNKRFEDAITSYQKASNLKPEELYPKEQIAEARKQLDGIAAEKAKQNQFNTIMADANNAFVANEFSQAKQLYEQALELYPNDKNAQRRLRQVEKQLQALADAARREEEQRRRIEEKKQRDYQNALANADRLFKANNWEGAKKGYQSALGIDNGQAYPEQRISQIDSLIADRENKKIKAEQLRLEHERKVKEARDKAYADAIAEADKLFNDGDYSNARSIYNQALGIKSDETYPRDRIAMIDKIKADEAAKKRKLDNDYAAAIRAANDLFRRGRYKEAKAKYEEALLLKPNEQYPKDQIARIEQELTRLAEEARQDSLYNAAMNDGNAKFAAQQYTEAIEAYNKARQLKNTEREPAQRIADAEAKLEEQRLAQAREKANRDAYNEAVKKGDLAMAQGDLTAARLTYNEALALYPNELYPQQRISEIDSQIKAERDRIAREYADAMARGNELFSQGKYAEAKSAYQDALTKKPNDRVALDKIKSVDKKLEEQRLAEQKERDKRREFIDLTAQADLAYNSDRLDRAAELYAKALELYPDEAHPRTQLDKIKNILDEQKRVRDGYNNAMAEGNRAALNNDWATAREAYQKALSFKPEDTAAREKLNEANRKAEEIRLAQEKEKAKRAEYERRMADADSLFDNNNLEAARKAYNDALALYDNENRPKQRIREIDQKIEAERRRIAKGYNDAFKQGERLYRAGQYEQAKEQFNKALTFKPADQNAMAKIREIDQKIDDKKYAEAQEKEKRDRYNLLVNSADSAFNADDYNRSKELYNEAIRLYPEEKYVKDRIADIGRIEKERQANDAAFQKAIDEANALAAKGNYKAAIEKVNSALRIKPNDSVAIAMKEDFSEKLNQQIIAEQKEKEERSKYQSLITQANEQFNMGNLEAARALYNEALALYPDESFPKRRIKEIDRLIQERIEKGYKVAINAGNLLAKQERYVLAKKKYEDALEFKPNDAFALQKIEEMDRLIAEQRKKQEKQAQIDADYSKKLETADIAFDEAKYESAKSAYENALNIRPKDQYAAAQIAKVDSILAAQREKQRIAEAFHKAIQDANRYMSAGQLDEARRSYADAANIRPDENFPKVQISKIDSLLKNRQELKQLAEQERLQKEAVEKEKRRKYDKYIAQGDKAFKGENYDEAKKAYLNALQFYPNDEYAKKQIDRINQRIVDIEDAKNRLAQKEKFAKDSLIRVQVARFDSLVSAGKVKVLNKDFDLGIADYEAAIETWEEKRPVVEPLIEEARRLKRKYKEETKLYNDKIKQADRVYAQNQLKKALRLYQEALFIRPQEKYPKDKIAEINAYLNRQKEKLTQVLKNAGNHFNEKRYQQAYREYSKAKQMDEENELANSRLSELRNLMDAKGQAQVENEVNAQAAKEAISNGDEAMNAGQLVQAKMFYERALKQNPNEDHAKRQMERINKQLEDRRNDRRLAKDNERDALYNAAIALADKEFAAGNYISAKLNYQKAHIIKENERYPITQIAKILKILNRPDYQNPNKTERLIAQRKQTYRENEAITKRLKAADDAAYREAIALGDKNLRLKKYSVARYHYYRALDLQPGDEYATKQIELIRRLVNATLDRQLNEAYDRNIRLADASFDKEDYSVAKHYYVIALSLKNWERHPKDRLNLIESLSQNDVDEKVIREYNSFIRKADEAYVKRQLAVARFYYIKASQVRPDRDYPKIKLKDIAAALSQGKRNETNLEYEANITKANKAFRSKNYPIARFYYMKALRLRPDEQYPRQQINQITKILTEKR